MLDPCLMKMLVCADCRHSLSEKDGSLVCTSCKRRYEIQDGIPALYPQSVDQTHLVEEEHLAVQRTGEPTPLQRFRSAQWKLSKSEFWTMVEDRIRDANNGGFPAGKSMINVGCGYDDSFRPFQDQGVVFVNFDLVHCKVSHLKNAEGAKLCVVGDIGAMPFAESSFDYLVAVDVVHHEWGKLDQILGSFWDLIKPGGMLFLQEPNRHAVFQLAKSMLPRPVYRAARIAYHRMKRSKEKPADYEFPMSMRAMMKTLERMGFENISVYGNYAYPHSNPLRHRVYQALSKSKYVRTCHNYHFTMSAVKPSEGNSLP